MGSSNPYPRRPSDPLKYGYDHERAAISISLVLDLSDCCICSPALFIACRSEKIRRGAVIASPVRRIAMDAAGIRSAPVCFSRSGPPQKSTFTRAGERVASFASRIASRSDKGSCEAAFRTGDFGYPVRTDLCRLTQPAFNNDSYHGDLDRVFVLRSGSL